MIKNDKRKHAEPFSKTVTIQYDDAEYAALFIHLYFPVESPTSKLATTKLNNGIAIIPV